MQNAHTKLRDATTVFNAAAAAAVRFSAADPLDRAKADATAAATAAATAKANSEYSAFDAASAASQAAAPTAAAPTAAAPTAAAATALSAAAPAAEDPPPSYSPDPDGHPDLVFEPQELLALRLLRPTSAGEKPEFRVELAARYDTDTKYLVLIVKSRDVLHHKANTSAIVMAIAAATERYNDAHEDKDYDFDVTFGGYEVLVVVYSDRADLNSAADPASRDAMFARVASTFGDRISGIPTPSGTKGKTRALDDSGDGSVRYLVDEQFTDAWKEYEEKGVTNPPGTVLLVGSTLAEGARRQKLTSDKVFVVDPPDLTDESDLRGANVAVRLTQEFVDAKRTRLSLGKLANTRVFQPSHGFVIQGGAADGGRGKNSKTRWRPAGERRASRKPPVESKRAAAERRADAVRQAVIMYKSRAAWHQRHQQRQRQQRTLKTLAVGSLQLGGYAFADDDPDATFYRVMFRVRGTEAPDDGPDGLDFFFRLADLEDGTAAPLRLSEDRMWLDLMGDKTGLVKAKYSELLEPGVTTTTLEDDDRTDKAVEALTTVGKLKTDADTTVANVEAYNGKLDENITSIMNKTIVAALDTVPPAPPHSLTAIAKTTGVSTSGEVAASLRKMKKSNEDLTRIHGLMVDAITSPNAIADPVARNERAQALLRDAIIARNGVQKAEADFIVAGGAVLADIIKKQIAAAATAAGAAAAALAGADAAAADAAAAAAAADAALTDAEKDAIKAKINGMPKSVPNEKYSREIALAVWNAVLSSQSGGGGCSGGCIGGSEAAASGGSAAASGIDLGAAVYILTAVRSAAVAVGFVDIKNAPRGGRWKAARAIVLRDGAFGLAATLLMVAVAGGDPIALSVAFAVTWAAMALIVAAFVVADAAAADMRSRGPAARSATTHRLTDSPRAR